MISNDEEHFLRCWSSGIRHNLLWHRGHMLTQTERFACCFLFSEQKIFAPFSRRSTPAESRFEWFPSQKWKNQSPIKVAWPFRAQLQNLYFSEFLLFFGRCSSKVSYRTVNAWRLMLKNVRVWVKLIICFVFRFIYQPKHNLSVFFRFRKFYSNPNGQTTILTIKCICLFIHLLLCASLRSWVEDGYFNLLTKRGVPPWPSR